VHARDGGLEQRDAVGPFPLRIGVGKHAADVAGVGGAEHGVGHRMAHDVGIGMTGKSKLERNGDAGEDQRAPGHQLVKIVAVANSHQTVRAARVRQVLGRRDLDVPGIAFHHVHGQAEAFDQHRLVGGVDRSPFVEGSREEIAAERLWRLCQEYGVARDGGADRPRSVVVLIAGLLDRVAHRDGGDGGAVRARGVDGAGDRLERHERARRIVNHDDVGAVRRPRQAVGHRVLPAGAARYEGDGRGRRTPALAGAGQMIVRQRHHDVADAIAGGQGGAAHLEDRAAADVEELLGPIGAETQASSPGGDDGGHVHAGRELYD
jgi:hypothetical protein